MKTQIIFDKLPKNSPLKDIGFINEIFFILKDFNYEQIDFLAQGTNSLILKAFKLNSFIAIKVLRFNQEENMQQ